MRIGIIKSNFFPSGGGSERSTHCLVTQLQARHHAVHVLAARWDETAAAAGVNPYRMEMANLREHVSWVHNDRRVATAKAIDIVGMLVAIGVFRAAGCMDYVMGAIGAAVAALGWNTDFLPALPVGLMKILSGSGARGLMVDVMQTHGVDSFPARLAAIIQGSTETTFYVLAVYFGSVGVKDTRHALGCALIADAVGIVAAIGVAYAFYR